MNNQIPPTNCDKNITETNLLLAQLLLKTTDETTNLSDNPALLLITWSLSKSSKPYLARSTPLQWNPNVNAHSRAISDSSTSSTCCDSLLTLPFSVHVADVTHGTCVAHKHPASHGVSVTVNETNVNRGIMSRETEGMSFSVSFPNGLSRKRQAPETMTNNCMPALSCSKRCNQEWNDNTCSYKPIGRNKQSYQQDCTG
jgi:hypothetical protein